jgi:quinol monooxygenase YgiN
MIYAIARITIPSPKVKDALEILCSVTQRSRFERGCIRSTVYRDVEVENAVMLEQVWENEDDLANHLRSDEYRKVLLVAEMALPRPEIRFDVVARTTGVETIEKARIARPRETSDEYRHPDAGQAIRPKMSTGLRRVHPLKEHNPMISILQSRTTNNKKD